MQTERSARPDFAVCLPARQLSDKEIDHSVRAFARFFNSVTHRHQRRSRFALIGASAAQQELIEHLWNRLGLPESALLRKQTFFSEFEAILLLPTRQVTDSARTEALGLGLPVIAFDVWERARSFDSGFCVFISQALDDQTVKEFGSHIRMIYFDSAALKMLRQRASAFARKLSPFSAAIA